VLPHGPGGTRHLADRVGKAEEFYAGRGEAARFQITPGVCPQGLDEWLAARGYAKHDPVSLQVASTKEVVHRLRGGLRAEVDDAPTASWFHAWYSVHGSGSDPRCERELLARVELPSRYASMKIGQRVVGVGRVVLDSGWAGVFGMATLPEARGKGIGRTVLDSLAIWADAQHIDRLYLQVEQGNTRAVRLYRHAGFTEVCEYHYRSGHQTQRRPHGRHS
jgi:GNAT superfamily N-acetyltransferase